MRVIGYVRVSDVNGRAGDRFISPDVQREAIERFVQGKRHELVDVVVELDVSGGTLARPGLDEALARLEAGEADAIAVAYLSRLSRRVLDGLGIVQRLNDAGRHVLIADLDLDTSTNIGKAVLAVLLAFAELELNERRDSWATAQRHALERGVYPGSTPIGYLRDEDGRMVPNPATAPAVRKLFDRRLAGDSWSELARMLDRELPREDGTPWRPSTVADLVTTPLNIGRLERAVGGERIVVENAHEPLVSRAVWEAVANGRPNVNGTVHRDEPAMLAGLIRCAGCGGPMSRAGNGKGRLSATGERLRYDHYTCLRRCAEAARMSVRPVDDYVIAETLEHLAQSAAVDAARHNDDEVGSAERTVEHAEAELAAYLSAVSALDVGEAAFAVGARERRRQVDAARRALAQAAAKARVRGPAHADLVDQLPTMSDGDKNRLLRTIIDRVLVKKAGQPGRRGDPRERVEIIFRGDDAPKQELELVDDVGRKRSAVAA
jgi:DNA invertase Pin-like site-specific DNA recombinase